MTGNGKDEPDLADQDFRSAMAAMIAKRWDDVWEALPRATAGDDPEGVHDVRVASRRLRAAMDVAVDCFPSSWYKPLHKAAKEITSELGEVRDREVLLAALEAERAAVPPDERAGLDHLIERTQAELNGYRAEMLRFLARLERRGVREEVRRRFGKYLADRTDHDEAGAA